ncbi:MAG: AMP-binding protein [Bacteroidales bacterium]|nr:AMP-binding protein [Bacteroidales bacterium]
MNFQSVNKLFEKSFRENWDRPALSNYQGDTFTYGELATKIELLHMGFQACGLKKGDKIAICGRNQANWAVSFLATMTYGAVPVPILHEFKPGNVHYLVNHSQAKAFFVDEMIWENLSEEEMPGLVVIVSMKDLKYIYSKSEEMLRIRNGIFRAFLKKHPDRLHPEDLDYYEDSAEELALINYTSGTSGFSKGVMIPYRALYANIFAARYVAEPQMDNTSKMVAMLPSAHMYGMMFELLFEMTIGAHTHFLTRVPSPKIILKAFQEIHPAVIIAVPLIIEKVYKMQLKPVLDRTKTFRKIPILGQAITYKIRSELIKAFGGEFEEVILGGAAFNPDIEQFFHKIRFPYTVGYGMTECAPLLTYEKWSRLPKGSCGKAIPGCEIRVDSPDPENVPGEIQVRGENVFLGYFRNEEETAKSFTDDGWFKTGDMGVMDSHGYLYLRGRIKCMILGPSGQNIYPEELEAVVNNVSYVSDSLVIEDTGGLTALVYPDYQQGAADGMSKEALMERLRAEVPEINKILPNYAQIKKMEFMPEDFERTPKRSIKRYLYQRNSK